MHNLPLVLEVVITGGGKVEGADPASEAGVVLQAAVWRPDKRQKVIFFLIQLRTR